jgi:transcriptional regulator with XRE-family HTH domain
MSRNVDHTEGKQMTSDIGERIRAIRLEKGMMLVTLAGEVGISKGYLSLLECGKRNFSAERVREIAAALEVSVGALYGETDWRDEVEPQEPKGKHLRRISRKSMRTRLRPLLRARTNKAVDLLELWLEAPEEARRLLEERIAASPKASKRSSKRSRAA